MIFQRCPPTYYLSQNITFKINQCAKKKTGNVCYILKLENVKPTGILHLASDWVIVSDLQNSYIFPGHIALTSLRPDIVIFSNSLKRVILIELTCPCEENMESWHSIKNLISILP